MMTYIFIGAILLIVLAILFTLRSDRKKDKKIYDLSNWYRKKEDEWIKSLEFMDARETIRAQEVRVLTEERNFYRDILNEISEDISEVELLGGNLKRWNILVDDCKKPFVKKKQPINVGGKFTRSMIIAVDDIVNVVNEIANKHNPKAQ